MTRRILSGATRDSKGVRVCPRGCSGVDRGPGVQTGCLAAKRKTIAPGVTLYEPPAPGTCSMFYNEKKEPT
jgi:hypothetical protein